MKKLFIVLVLGAFVACNESGSAEATADSTAAVVDSTTNAMTDSISTGADSMINKMDSTAEAVTDSLKK